MDQSPPYTPTVTNRDRYLPPDYFDDGESPRLPKTLTSPRAKSRTDALSLLEGQQNNLTHASSAPPTAHYCLAEPPPDYASLDTLAHAFRLDGPLIYATKTSNTPRYQLMQEFTRSGRPLKLHIRRLLASEARQHLLPSTLSTPPRISYDMDGTMYRITGYEMRGHRSSTLAGSIQLESGSSILSGKWVKIWHFTKNVKRDSLNPENEARMQKYGYHAEDEWDKRLLFSVKKGRWEDERGKKVAVEENGTEGRKFELLEQVSGSRRDLLVSCWVMRVWMVEGLRWEGDLKGW
ncbi:hypothetical protein K469DRAFT_709406 [Zopfia rhizophila CBS 207.26]|uniref:Uncharacterized protein n=1 Tax=Zopfia rhizophila CBS 207.26 TaxID=1314779 RepID=A0A6A6ERY5_9PEZI|nr:hypothetical protein K469DRAFT_709406 [Zopfia rhizophila CBS 207.26]